MKATFLTAEWRRLVMLNFPIDPAALAPYRPHGTELDSWQGTTFVSLVGFRFLDTRVKGIPIPLHRNFDEINLRFYVRSRGPEGWRRGVVFIREVVPRAAIALVARWLYKENYVACPTRSITRDPVGSDPGVAEYRWKHRGGWFTIGAEYCGDAAAPDPDSEEEFITEHYWGYSSRPDRGTVEYRVEHPRWRVWSARRTMLAGDFSAFYGPEFREALETAPSSSFVADGSRVAVKHAHQLCTKNR